MSLIHEDPIASDDDRCRSVAIDSCVRFAILGAILAGNILFFTGNGESGGAQLAVSHSRQVSDAPANEPDNHPDNLPDR